MIDLFMKTSCGYCMKVIAFLEENNIPYERVDITEPKNEELLLMLGGKRQVPFIFDKSTGVQMYESNDIIEYLKTLNT